MSSKYQVEMNRSSERGPKEGDCVTAITKSAASARTKKRLCGSRKGEWEVARGATGGEQIQLRLPALGFVEYAPGLYEACTSNKCQNVK